MYEVMLFDMQKYLYYEIVFNTLYIEIKHKFFKKFFFGQNKWYKKYPLFFANSNKSQFYF